MRGERKQVEWSQIIDGQPVEGGRLVYSLGTIIVGPLDEEQAQDSGGNPMVEIEDFSTPQGGPRWAIIGMTPHHPDLTAQWQREKIRFQLLKWYFDDYHAKGVGPVSYAFPARQLGFKEQDVLLARDYLVGQKLLRLKAPRDESAMITYEGIREVEHCLAFPSSPSNNLGIHMNQTNNFGKGNFGSVQIGDGNSASVSQNVGVSGDELANLASALNQELARLPVEQRVEAQEVVEGVLEEAEKEKPKLKVLTALIAAMPATMQALPAVADFVRKLGG